MRTQYSSLAMLVIALGLVVAFGRFSAANAAPSYNSGLIALTAGVTEGLAGMDTPLNPNAASNPGAATAAQNQTNNPRFPETFGLQGNYGQYEGGNG